MDLHAIKLHVLQIENSVSDNPAILVLVVLGVLTVAFLFVMFFEGLVVKMFPKKRKRPHRSSAK